MIVVGSHLLPTIPWIPHPSRFLRKGGLDSIRATHLIVVRFRIHQRDKCQGTTLALSPTRPKGARAAESCRQDSNKFLSLRRRPARSRSQQARGPQHARFSRVGGRSPGLACWDEEQRSARFKKLGTRFTLFVSHNSLLNLLTRTPISDNIYE
jgi:hypothetical protein